MDDNKNERKDRGITKDNSEGMNTKEAIGILKVMIFRMNIDNKDTDIIPSKTDITCTFHCKDYKLLEPIIELLQRGEVCEKMIDKMRKEKFDVWVSLPGSFTNLADFVDDIEKEVIK